MARFTWAILALQVLFCTQVWADDPIPNCPAYTLRRHNGGNPGSLPINNEQVLKWKVDSQNQYLDRARVQGPIVRIYPDRSSHYHFAISLTGSNDPNGKDTIEVIYNLSFGSEVKPRLGQMVEACGDYITSNAPSDGGNGRTYPASPDGAIIHWVHLAPPSSKHHSGYLVINGVLTGQGSGNRRRHTESLSWSPFFEGSPEEEFLSVESY